MRLFASLQELIGFEELLDRFEPVVSQSFDFHTFPNNPH